MAGRRLHSQSEVAARVDAALGIVDLIDPPEVLRHWCFMAAFNAVNRQGPLKDVEQDAGDIGEAVAIVTARDLSGPLAVAVAECALGQVSQREHVIAMPGQNREQRRHPAQ